MKAFSAQKHRQLNQDKSIWHVQLHEHQNLRDQEYRRDDQSVNDRFTTGLGYILSKENGCIASF